MAYSSWKERNEDYKTNKRAVSAKITKDFCSEAMKDRFLCRETNLDDFSGTAVGLLQRIKKFMETSEA